MTRSQVKLFDDMHLKNTSLIYSIFLTRAYNFLEQQKADNNREYTRILQCHIIFLTPKIKSYHEFKVNIKLTRFLKWTFNLHLWDTRGQCRKVKQEIRSHSSRGLSCYDICRSKRTAAKVPYNHNSMNETASTSHFPRRFINRSSLPLSQITLPSQ